MKKRTRWILGGLGVLVLGATIWLWPVISLLIAKGLPQGPEMRKYEGTSRDNLAAMRTALMLYHDNEDRFPDSSGWMSAIEKQLKTNDLTAEEAAKKLRNPNLLDAGPDDFGYALNDSVGGKFKGDIKDPKTVLVFESGSREKNAHGDPKKAKGTGIALDGTIVHLP